MSNLSKRERILLLVTGVLAIVVIFWYLLISPQLSARSSLFTEKQSLEIQVEIMEATIIPLEDYPGLLEEATAQFDEVAGTYQGALLTEGVDTLLTRAVNSFQLNPASITISEPAALSSDGSEIEAGSVPRVAYQVLVNQSLTGSKANLERYVDYVRDLPGVQLASFTFTEEGAGSGMTLSYTVTMIES